MLSILAVNITPQLIVYCRKNGEEPFNKASNIELMNKIRLYASEHADGEKSKWQICDHGSQIWIARESPAEMLPLQSKYLSQQAFEKIADRLERHTGKSIIST